MAIQALLGKPGAGKSYNAVQRVLDAIETGRVVVTSLPMKLTHPKLAAAVDAGLLVQLASPFAPEAPPDKSFSHLVAWMPAFMDGSPWSRELRDKKGEGSSKAGPLIIVDEAAGTLRPMIAAGKGRQKTGDFDKLLGLFETHRHHAVDVLLIYQDHSQIPAPIKALVERFHNFVNTSEMTAPLKTWTMRTTARGHMTANAVALAEAKGRFLAEVYELYDSHAEGSAKGEKVKLDRKGLLHSRPIWLRWWFLLLVASAIALPIFMYKTWSRVKSVSSFDKSALAGSNGALKGASTPALPGGSAGLHPAPSAAPIAGSVPPPATPTAAVVAPPGVGALNLVNGAPGAGAVLVGFSRSTMFFSDGGQIDTTDMLFAGWRVLSATPCRLVVATEKPRPEVRTYRCGKGF